MWDPLTSAPASLATEGFASGGGFDTGGGFGTDGAVRSGDPGAVFGGEPPVGN